MKRKRAAKKRVNPKRLIHTINEIFNDTLKKPALKNTILVVIAIALSKTLRINEIALHLPVAVKTKKTKQKRLLRFLKSKYPTQSVMEEWALFVLRTVGCPAKGKLLILIDETDLIEPFKAIVAAIPFGKRAIPIYWKIYTHAQIDSMEILSHNVLVQTFVEKLTHLCSAVIPKQRQLLVFDRGFARVQLMKAFKRQGIGFLIRVPKNVGIQIAGRVSKLGDIQMSGYHPSVVYHKTERIVVNLYCVVDVSEDDPMFIVSNCIEGISLYNCYKRRMQIEQGFRDLKSLFGFGALRLTQLTKARLRNLFLFVVISEGVLMLLYQKSGYRWSREFNDGKKQFSLIAVIKTVVADCFATFRLCPFFELPLPEVHILIE